MIWTGSPCLTCLGVACWGLGILSSAHSQWSGPVLLSPLRRVSFGSDHQSYFYFTGGALGSYSGGSVNMVAIPIYEEEGVSKLGHMSLCALRRYTNTQSVRSHPWFTFWTSLLPGLGNPCHYCPVFSKSCLLYCGEMSLMLSAVVDFNKNLNSESWNGLFTGSVSQQTK